MNFEDRLEQASNQTIDLIARTVNITYEFLSKHKTALLISSAIIAGLAYYVLLENEETKLKPRQDSFYNSNIKYVQNIENRLGV